MVTQIYTAWLSQHSPGDHGASTYYTVFTASKVGHGRTITATAALSTTDGRDTAAYADIDSYTKPFGPPVHLMKGESTVGASDVRTLTFHLWVARGVAFSVNTIFALD